MYDTELVNLQMKRNHLTCKNQFQMSSPRKCRFKVAQVYSTVSTVYNTVGACTVTCTTKYACTLAHWTLKYKAYNQDNI